jgi:RNA polymerase sigma-70 factor (ECF subfamily)
MQPSPVVTLNRAVALAMIDGPERALEVLDVLGQTGTLDNYHLLHATRADLLRRSGSFAAAAKAYERALELVTNDAEKRFLERRLREVSPS